MMISIILEGERSEKVKKHLRKYGPYYAAVGLVGAGVLSGLNRKNTKTEEKPNVTARSKDMDGYEPNPTKKKTDTPQKSVKSKVPPRKGSFAEQMRAAGEKKPPLSFADRMKSERAKAAGLHGFISQEDANVFRPSKKRIGVPKDSKPVEPKQKVPVIFSNPTSPEYKRGQPGLG